MGTRPSMSCWLALSMYAVVFQPTLLEETRDKGAGVCSATPHACSQVCTVTSNTPLCSCVLGYKLNEDAVHCSVANDSRDPFIIFNSGNEIKRFGLRKNRAPETMYYGLSVITAIAVDIPREVVYYVGEDQNSIESLILNEDLNLDSHQIVASKGFKEIRCLAVDWIARNLYIADSGAHQIVVCSVKSTVLCTPLITTDIYNVQSITVDPHNGKLYWGEVSVSGKIESSGLDGSGRNVLIDSHTDHMNSLYLDFPLQMLYWTDNEYVHGFNLKTLSPFEPNLNSLLNVKTIGVFEDDLIFSVLTESGFGGLSSTVYTLDKFETEGEEQTVARNLHEVNFLFIFHSALQITGVNPCKQSGCSHLCLISGSGTFVCACPPGRKLAADGRLCVADWKHPAVVVSHRGELLRLSMDFIGDNVDDVLYHSDYDLITAMAFDWATKTLYFSMNGSQSSIMSLDLNTPDASEVPFIDSAPTHITDMAIDWVSRNLYWIDADKGVIEVMTLGGLSRVTLRETSHPKLVVHPRAIAVDPINRKLYYSDCTEHAAHVGVCSLTGYHCYALYKSNCVIDICIEGNILILVEESGTILEAHSDGTKKSIVIQHGSPRSVGFVGEQLVWTDEQVSYLLSIFFKDRSDQLGEKIGVGRDGLHTMAVLSEASQPTAENACSRNNGGCEDVCIPLNDSRRDCFCEEGIRLDDDQISCMRKQKKTTSSTSAPTSRRTTTASRNVDDVFSLRERSTCSRNYCHDGGTCIASAEGIATCKCASGYVGDRCERKMETSDGGSVHTWITGTLTVVGVVMAALVAVTCLVKHKWSRSRRGRRRNDELDGKSDVNPVFVHNSLRGSLLNNSEKPFTLQSPKLVPGSCDKWRRDGDFNDSVDSAFVSRNDV